MTIRVKFIFEPRGPPVGTFGWISVALLSVQLPPLRTGVNAGPSDRSPLR